MTDRAVLAYVREHPSGLIHRLMPRPGRPSGTTICELRGPDLELLAAMPDVDEEFLCVTCFEYVHVPPEWEKGTLTARTQAHPR